MKHPLAALFCALALPLPAAELIPVPPPDVPAAQWGTLAVPCTHLLRGEIVKGDLDKLASADLYGGVLCLESPGGEINEALKIAEFIRSRSIGTRVPADATCASACALAFMAGGKLGSDSGEGTVLDRAIHPTAKLGFHAPQLVVKDRLYSQDSVTAAYALSLRILSRVVDTFVVTRATSEYDYAPQYIAPSLLSTLIDTPPDQMTYVTTVNQAGRWNIGVWPIAPHPDGIDMQDFYQDCANNVMWQSDVSAIGNRAFYHEWRAHPDFDGFAELRVVVDETSGLNCTYMLDMQSMQADAIAPADRDYFTFNVYGSRGPLSTFAPETQINDLPH